MRPRRVPGWRMRRTAPDGHRRQRPRRGRTWFQGEGFISALRCLDGAVLPCLPAGQICPEAPRYRGCRGRKKSRTWPTYLPQWNRREGKFLSKFSAVSAGEVILLHLCCIISSESTKTKRHRWQFNQPLADVERRPRAGRRIADGKRHLQEGDLRGREGEPSRSQAADVVCSSVGSCRIMSR